MMSRMRTFTCSLLCLAFLGGVFLGTGCSSEGEGTVTPTKTQGNKSRLEKIQSKADSVKSKTNTPSR